MTDAAAGSAALLDRLAGLHPIVIDLGLERVQALLGRLGHPERDVPAVVHAAGTNGKGSVLALMKAMAEADGRAVHRYSSPHLVRFHERILLAGREISEPALVDVLSDVEQAAQGLSITYFEITTAAAFLAFARVPADLTLLETGMGGRFDATNVVERPALTIITPIDYDHQDFLGDTLTEIAGEKAGIMKPGVPCYAADQHEEARAVLEETAVRLGVPLFVHGQDFSAYEEHGRLVFQDEHGLLDLPLPRLVGRHQIDNAGLALAAMRHLGARDAALAKGLETAVWPARMQRLTKGPLVERLRGGAGEGEAIGDVWLDGGHNVHGGQAMAQALADLDARLPRPLYLIVGMMSKKDPKAFLSVFEGLVRHVVAVPIPGERSALAADQVAQAANAVGLDASQAETPDAALGRILQMTREDGESAPRVLICGSLYLAGHILAEHG